MSASNPHLRQRLLWDDVARLRVAQLWMDRAEIDTQRVVSHERVVRHTQRGADGVNHGSLEEARAEPSGQVVEVLTVGAVHNRSQPLAEQRERRARLVVHTDVCVAGVGDRREHVVDVVLVVLGRVLVEPLRWQAVGGDTLGADAVGGLNVDPHVQYRVPDKLGNAVSERHP